MFQSMFSIDHRLVCFHSLPALVQVYLDILPPSCLCVPRLLSSRSAKADYAVCAESTLDVRALSPHPVSTLSGCNHAHMHR